LVGALLLGFAVMAWQNDWPLRKVHWVKMKMTSDSKPLRPFRWPKDAVAPR
jgi:hypothetical protein